MGCLTIQAWHGNLFPLRTTSYLKKIYIKTENLDALGLALKLDATTEVQKEQ